ncbi:hypothetical protein [Jannaschia marina]|uniref:hypothetical protein n=1 Tax=Jannaschia marina TaxID=2741674 RepID=UPI001F3ECABD|nr:hypothetical protein [Jannaschia marina]
MNLLTRHTPASYEAWKSDFDASAESRMNAGLTLMQLQRDVDGNGLTAFFGVNDRKKAQPGSTRHTKPTAPLRVAS